MAKKTPWIPPADIVQEIRDAASYRLGENDIYPADTVKPQAEKLREKLNELLAWGINDHEAPDAERDRAQVFACLKDALVKARADLEAREYIRKAYERDERLAKEQLETLKVVAREMLEAYGGGSEEEPGRLHTPIGDIRFQRNSSGSVWVDESRIDEIPEKLGEFQLVKVEKTVSKTGVGALLEYLEEQGKEKPDWAELRPPGFQVRF